MMFGPIRDCAFTIYILKGISPRNLGKVEQWKSIFQQLTT